ncbi:hypothetical protein SAXI111661_20075 [Saccharomonospora xinjiangensis]
MLTRPYPTYFAGCSDRFTPPAIATVHSPDRRLATARCTAVSDDEHSVSTARLGPWKSQKNDTRLAIWPWLRPIGTGSPPSVVCSTPDSG